MILERTYKRVPSYNRLKLTLCRTEFNAYRLAIGDNIVTLTETEFDKLIKDMIAYKIDNPVIT